MNGFALLGILLIIYAIAVVGLAVKKPENIWKMAKIQLFIKVLGEKGTEIFFYVFALICAIFGVWLMLK